MSSDMKLVLPFEVSNNSYNSHEYFASGTTTHGKYASGSFDDRDMMTRSKVLAFEPCDKKSSHQRLYNQMHNVHVHLNSNSKSSRKRKFDRYINDGKFATTYHLIDKTKYDNENDKVPRRIRCSSFLCSPLYEEKWDISQRTQEHVAFPALNNKAEYCRICIEDYSHLSDFDDSIKGPNPMRQGSMKGHPKDLMASSSYTFSTKTSIMEKTKMEDVKVLKLVDENFAGGKTSPSLSLKEEDMELIHPDKKFLPSKGSHLPRPIIPLGPRFQAEVPKWEGTTNIKHHRSDDGLKWLGTQIWPMPIKSKTNTQGIEKGRPNSCSCDFLGSVDCVQNHVGNARKLLKLEIDTTFSSWKFDDMGEVVSIKSKTDTNDIGKGRHDTCSCDFPGSVDCVQKHVSEARKLLKLEIGTAFSSWKFDDVGEDVSKSWTLKEQKEFESLVKLNPLSKDANFWELAMEHFPSKSLKCMVNYYFNVYIPRRMSMETRSSFGAADRKPKGELQD